MVGIQQRNVSGVYAPFGTVYDNTVGRLGRLGYRIVCQLLPQPRLNQANLAEAIKHIRLLEHYRYLPSKTWRGLINNPDFIEKLKMIERNYLDREASLGDQIELTSSFNQSLSDEYDKLIKDYAPPPGRKPPPLPAR